MPDAPPAGVLVAWITVVNSAYLLMQIAIAIERVGLAEAIGAVLRFVQDEFCDVAGVFVVTLAPVITATLVSAMASSGVWLIAFVPLVGLAVFSLKVAALLLRGVVFEYIGLTARGAYVTVCAAPAS